MIHMAPAELLPFHGEASSSEHSSSFCRFKCYEEIESRTAAGDLLLSYGEEGQRGREGGRGRGGRRREKASGRVSKPENHRAACCVRRN